MDEMLIFVCQNEKGKLDYAWVAFAQDHVSKTFHA